MLYIPCGYWHKADALPLSVGEGWGEVKSDRNAPSPYPLPKGEGFPEAAISLAIGVMSRTAMDVYDCLRKRLTQSLVWRQRLPLPNEPSRSRGELEETYRHLFRRLADDFAKTLSDPQIVEEFLRSFEQRDTA